jgi:hypothetical protein
VEIMKKDKPIFGYRTKFNLKPRPLGYGKKFGRCAACGSELRHKHIEEAEGFRCLVACPHCTPEIRDVVGDFPVYLQYERR